MVPRKEQSRRPRLHPDLRLKHHIYALTLRAEMTSFQKATTSSVVAESANRKRAATEALAAHRRLEEELARLQVKGDPPAEVVAQSKGKPVQVDDQCQKSTKGVSFCEVLEVALIYFYLTHWQFSDDAELFDDFGDVKVGSQHISKKLANVYVRSFFFSLICLNFFWAQNDEAPFEEWHRVIYLSFGFLI